MAAVNTSVAKAIVHSISERAQGCMSRLFFKLHSMNLLRNCAPHMSSPDVVRAHVYSCGCLSTLRSLPYCRTYCLQFFIPLIRVRFHGESPARNEAKLAYRIKINAFRSIGESPKIFRKECMTRLDLLFSRFFLNRTSNASNNF